jgi:hypothetical protein
VRTNIPAPMMQPTPFAGCSLALNLRDRLARKHPLDD